MIHLTRHANKRRKRLNIPKEALMRLMVKVIKFGIQKENVKGKIRKYFDFLFNKENSGVNRIFIYGLFVYLLVGETLITILHLPKEFHLYKIYLK